MIRAEAEKTGRLPKIADIMSALSLRKYPAQMMLKTLADEGFLRKAKNNWYELHDGAPAPIPTNTPVIFPVLTDAVTLFDEPLKGNPLALPVIKWSMLVVGIGSVIISAYYNVLLALDFLPAFLAVIAGCIFVLFSVVDFEAILLFSTFKSMYKWKRRGVMAGLIVVWLVAAAFSITSVVNGRYEKYMNMQRDKSSSNIGLNAGRLRWQNLQERKQTLTARITERRKYLGRDNLVSDRVLDKSNNDLEKLRGLEADMLKKNPESTGANKAAGEYTDFYEWLGEILGVAKEKIHFSISLLPAFFFDIFSPIAIAMFLFLKRD